MNTEQKARRALLAWLRKKRREAERMSDLHPKTSMAQERAVHHGRAQAFHETARYLARTWRKK